MRVRVPERIETDGYRWVAIRVSPSLPTHCAEFILTDELRSRGVNSYCPVAQSWAIWEGRKRAPAGTIRQSPVFSRYIFCGLLPHQTVKREPRNHVESVLSDSSGPLNIPPSVIRQINAWEFEGMWDESKVRSCEFRPGDPVSISEGAFAGHKATVSEVESEERIKLLINMFGRQTPAYVTARQIAAAGIEQRT